MRFGQGGGEIWSRGGEIWSRGVRFGQGGGEIWSMGTGAPFTPLNGALLINLAGVASCLGGGTTLALVLRC